MKKFTYIKLLIDWIGQSGNQLILMKLHADGTCKGNGAIAVGCFSAACICLAALGFKDNGYRLFEALFTLGTGTLAYGFSAQHFAVALVSFIVITLFILAAIYKTFTDIDKDIPESREQLLQTIKDLKEKNADLEAALGDTKGEDSVRRDLSTAAETTTAPLEIVIDRAIPALGDTKGEDSVLRDLSTAAETTTAPLEIVILEIVIDRAIPDQPPSPKPSLPQGVLNASFRRKKQLSAGVRAFLQQKMKWRNPQTDVSHRLN